MPHSAFDHLEVPRCPMLGGGVTFGYCRKLNDGLPCRRALVCWELKFPVVEFFRHALKPETFQTVFFSEPEGRLEGLLGAIDEAKKDGR